MSYIRIAKKCNEKKVYCILYAKGILKRELYDKYFYVNNANYGSTVIERILNLLYLG